MANQSNQGGGSSNRGFASMDKERQREIASEGGKASGGNLGVEHRMGRLAGKVADDLDILPTGMDDFEDIFILGQQIEQWLEIEAVSFGVDRCCFMFISDLNETQIGPIGVFAHEFRINRDERRFCPARAQFFQRLGGRDEIMNLHDLSA